ACEAAREDGGEPRSPARLDLARLVAPVDRRSKRLVSRKGRSYGGSQQPEAVVEPRFDVGNGQNFALGRSEFNCQRHAVQVLADSGGVLQFVGRQMVFADVVAALDEQFKRLTRNAAFSSD